MSIHQYLLINQDIFLILLFILGLLIGSFLNVVISRFPQMLMQDWNNQCCELLAISNKKSSETISLIYPGSRCPDCKSSIKAIDNIPVISYLFLRGKCRHCNQSISIKYPAIELLTAITSFTVGLVFGYSVETLFALIFTWSLICLTFIDIDHQLLPDDITLPLLWLGIICNIFNLYTDIYSSLLGVIFGYLALWIIYKLFKLLTRKEGMGYGDFKLLAMLGAWAGWETLPIIILISSIAGSIVGIFLIASGKHENDKPIPFGPYLAISGWISFLWGDFIISQYLNF